MMITGTNENDVELLQGVAQSDSRSIQQVYNTAFPRIDIMIRKSGGSRQDAQDIFQDAMMALFQRLHTSDFHLSCRLASYLQVVCRKMYLSRSRRKSMKSLDEITEFKEIGLDADYFDSLLRQDKQKLLYKHFNALGDDCKQILKLFFDRVPMKEIARQMGSTENYMKKRKFICKSKLMQRVQADPLYNEIVHD